MLFFEQLGEPAGRGVADHLGDLTHGEIRVDEQVLRLAHSPALNILRDAAAELALKATLELAFAHTGDARQALQGNIEGVMIGNIADHVLQALRVRRRKEALPPLALPFPGVHHQGDGLRDLRLVEKRRRRALAPVIFNLEEQLGHGGEIRGLIHALKGGGQIEIQLGIPLFQKIIIIIGKNLNAHGMNGDALVDKRAVSRLAAHDCLNIPRRQPPVGGQLLAGDGIVALNADAFRNRHIQALIRVKEKIVDLNIEQLLLGVNPVIAAAHRGRNFPALPRRAEFIRAGDGQEAVPLQKRTIVIR